MLFITIYRLVFGRAEKKYNETSEKYRELQSRYFSKSEYWVSFFVALCMQLSIACLLSLLCSQ